MLVIKRYPNRKLYDTSTSCYITLGDLEKFVRRGVIFQVLDHASAEDITAQTLSQVIFEQGKKQAAYLPQTVLAGILKARGETLAHIRQSLSLPLELHIHVNEEIHRRLNWLVAQGELSEADSESLFNKLILAEQGADHPTSMIDALVERFVEQQSVPSRRTIQALAAQIEQLTEQVDALMRDK